jgi:hypothetical protein
MTPIPRIAHFLRDRTLSKEEATMTRATTVYIAAAVAALVGVTVPDLHAGGQSRKSPIQLEQARLIIELNDTAQDVGVQVFLDAEPWKTMEIISPDGRRIFEVKGKANVGSLGLTELFAESNEPSLDELSLEEFLALFPEGVYRFSGTTPDGEDLVGEATFTHAIPAAPIVTSPAEGSAQDPQHTVVVWTPGTDKPGVEVVEYQVIVERDDPVRTFSVNVPASVTSVTVPPEFLEPGVEYKLEVLAIEAGRNQTITESVFTTQ